MNINPLKQLGEQGQSLWLDYIRKDLIHSGELSRLISEDGIRGMTSNPAIFEKSISGSHDYDDNIEALASEGKDANEIYETLSQRDVQDAADAFLPLYQMTSGRDGYVSLEVNPHLAHDTTGTFLEARRLWDAVARPNLLIKVPATVEGLPAIQQLIGEGINVNVTLIFGLPRYRQVAEAFIGGIEARMTQGKTVKQVASVASFFISRIDTLVDQLLEVIIKRGGEDAKLAHEVRGQIAIACAKMAYQIYMEIFGSDRFTNLASHGALAQRLLWASTGTKNPEYRDVKYIESLIGPNTVNTAPIKTINAFRDHGVTTPSLGTDVGEAAHALNCLPRLGIDMDQVTQQLEDEGIATFIRPFEHLMDSLDHHHVRTAR